MAHVMPLGSRAGVGIQPALLCPLPPRPHLPPALPFLCPEATATLSHSLCQPVLAGINSPFLGLDPALLDPELGLEPACWLSLFLSSGECALLHTFMLFMTHLGASARDKCTGELGLFCKAAILNTYKEVGMTEHN